NCELQQQDTNIVLLIEHQSTPDKLMAFRVHLYLFSMLAKKQRLNKLTQLPPIYALVFYHGKQTPYPYSLKLEDCFDDPLGIMHNVLTKPVPLIDVNQLSEEQLWQQRWVSPMAAALRFSRGYNLPDGIDVGDVLIRILKDMDNAETADDELAQVKDLIHSLLSYMFNGDNIELGDNFEEKVQGLHAPLRGELMTYAEKLIARGEEAGLEKGEQAGLVKGKQEVAINLLREGAEPPFVAKVTQLELGTVLMLKASIDN
ncbi:MAG: hypothetical protein COA42_09510, partial [Alteromonadaceae bacterium]